MLIFVIDASTMGPELQGGLIGVVGSVFPTAAEKKECVWRRSAGTPRMGGRSQLTRER